MTNKERLAEIRKLKLQLKKLLRKGESVYVEYSANNSKLV